MKLDFKKFKKNDFVQTLVLASITAILMLLIIECPIQAQSFCTGIVIFAAFLNLLRRKDDSIFSQVRTPMLTGFALIANKLKTSLDLMFKPEVLDTSKIAKLNFENTSLALVIVSLCFTVAIGMIVWMFLNFDEANSNATRLESFPSEKNNDRFSNCLLCLAKILCVTTVISGFLGAVSRPLYLRIISGSFDFVYFQKYLILSSIDMVLHSGAIVILYISVVFYNKSFTTEQGGFLITDDKRIIKYKGKSKQIYVPRDFKLFMTDTFENCDKEISNSL